MSRINRGLHTGFRSTSQQLVGDVSPSTSKTRVTMIEHKPEFVKKIYELGGTGILKCYQCGSCTAICPITENLNINFRKIVRYIQLGLEDSIQSILGDPKTLWLCLHCGLCAEICPRGAGPGDVIHALRAYIVAKWRER